MNQRYSVERLPNGLIRVFDRASKLSACYYADGSYAHGDLRAATLDALLADDAPVLLTLPVKQSMLELSHVGDSVLLTADD